MDHFTIGTRPVFTATFSDPDGVVTAPSTVVFKWRTPAGGESSYALGTASEVTTVSPGVYRFTPPTLTVAGKHVCRAVGTGTVATAEEFVITALRSAFTNP